MSYTLFHIPFYKAPVQEVIECTNEPYPICMVEKNKRTKVKNHSTERYFIAKHGSVKIKR